LTFVLHTHIVHPEYVPNATAVLAESVRTHGRFEVTHRAIRRETGGIGHMPERRTHCDDAGGVAGRSIGVVMDITDREPAEQERGRLQAQLLRSRKMSRRAAWPAGYAKHWARSNRRISNLTVCNAVARYRCTAC
jgi:hypothetical protein